MNELEQARQNINAIDAKMAALFEERMKQVEAVAKYKIANALPTLDSSREEEVIARNGKLIQNPVFREYYVSFLKDLMRTSRSYQGRLMQGMKVSFSGVPGAFAYIAAKKLFPDAELLAFPDFEDAYAACEDSRTDAVILPVENSFAGDVGSVMDLAFFGSLHINMMLNLDVTQNLLGAKGASKITYVSNVSLSTPGSFARALLNSIKPETTVFSEKLSSLWVMVLMSLCLMRISSLSSLTPLSLFSITRFHTLHKNR